MKRALKNLSPDDRAAREHDKRNHHLALYANSASVPIHLQPSAVRLRSNCDFDVVAGVAVIAVTHGPAHPIRRPFIIVSLPNAAREGAPFLHRRAAHIKPVNFIEFRRECRPNLGAVRRKIRQHRHDALGRNGGAEVERDLGHLALIDTPVRRQRQTESLATMRALTCIKAVEPTVWPSCHSVSAIREWPMDDTLKSKILELLDQHRLMTVATNRPDGAVIARPLMARSPTKLRGRSGNAFSRRTSRSGAFSPVVAR